MTQIKTHINIIKEIILFLLLSLIINLLTIVFLAEGSVQKISQNPENQYETKNKENKQTLIDSINKESDLFIKEIMDKKSLMLSKIKDKKERKAKNKQITKKIDEIKANIALIKNQINISKVTKADNKTKKKTKAKKKQKK